MAHERRSLGTRSPTTPFNCVCCRGMAAKARSVHLVYSMDLKLGWEGGGRRHPQHVAQGHPFSTN